jgi:hypothetical protein
MNCIVVYAIYIFSRLNGLVLLGHASKFDAEDIWWRYYNQFTILILVTISLVLFSFSTKNFAIFFLSLCCVVNDIHSGFHLPTFFLFFFPVGFLSLYASLLLHSCSPLGNLLTRLYVCRD